LLYFWSIRTREHNLSPWLVVCYKSFVMGLISHYKYIFSTYIATCDGCGLSLQLFIICIIVLVVWCATDMWCFWWIGFFGLQLVGTKGMCYCPRGIWWFQITLIADLHVYGIWQYQLEALLIYVFVVDTNVPSFLLLLVLLPFPSNWFFNLATTFQPCRLFC